MPIIGPCIVRVLIELRKNGDFAYARASSGALKYRTAATIMGRFTFLSAARVVPRRSHDRSTARGSEQEETGEGR
jgi:hypothetical protein